jgi:alginate O-acetyltransferase complex protein AlgJ
MHKRNACIALFALTACHPSGAKVPWAEPPTAAPADAHAKVRTLTRNYSRQRSHVLVREIDEPTRAALDYAAYHANFMLAGRAPATTPPPPAAIDNEAPFGGMIERASLTADVAAMPLTASERGRPRAFAPLAQYLLARRIEGAEALDQLGAAVRGETWGGSEGAVSQSISEVYFHHGGGEPELWVKVEFAPWFKALGTLPDPDHDGYPEVYGRARQDRMSAELATAIESDYGSRILTAAETQTWASELSAQWQPAFNTQLVAAGPTWPDAQTEPEITRELKGLSVDTPSIVMRGARGAHTEYVVFIVKQPAPADAPHDLED